MLYEKCLKIFGDIFESIIGAIFLDSRSLEITSKVLFNLLDPYIKVYSNEANMQDHKRTVLLELWSSKHWGKNLKISHLLENRPNDSLLRGYV